MPVYLIRAGETGPVKIGTACSIPDALNRIDSLQVAHWETLRLLRMWSGETSEEKQLHTRFADLRIRGEWFSFSRLMLGEVGLAAIDISHLGREADAPMRALDIARRLGGMGDLARLCGTSRATVSWWCRDNNIPSEQWATLIDRALEMGVPDITEGVLSRIVPIGDNRVRRARRGMRGLVAVIAKDISGPERAAEWAVLRSQRVPFIDIASAYGVSRQRVHQAVVKFNATKPLTPDLAAFTGIPERDIRPDMYPAQEAAA